jgi:anti-sigma regulatory factor (Ser/Thr protein kinase)
MDVASEKPVRMVTLTLQADRDYLALARTSAMHVGALLFLPLTQVHDLRLAVDEACSSFLQALRRSADGSAAGQAETMEISYDRYPSALHVAVRARAPQGWPAHDELGWALLGSLVGEVTVSVEDGVGTLTLIEPLPSAPSKEPAAPPPASV